MFESHRQEESDVFGFKWKMSYAEASKIASGKIEKDNEPSGFLRTIKIENPKEPLGAKCIYLSFFDDELHCVTVIFFFHDSCEFKKKMDGIIEVLGAKYSGAKMSREESGSHTTRYLFDYLYKGGVIENPYNMEEVRVSGVGGISDAPSLLTVSYLFYGHAKMDEHIKKLENEKEFRGF